MRDGAFALLWIALLPMSVVSPQVGVLLWIWIAILSPNDFLYGALATVQFNKVVAGMTLAIMVLSKTKKDFYLDKTGALILAMLLVATLSWLFGLIPPEIGFEQYLKLAKEFVLAGAVMWLMTTRHRIHYAVVTICLTIGYFAVREGSQFLLTAGGHKVLGVQSIGDNNSFATAVLMCVPLLLYLARYAQVAGVRLCYQGATLFCLLAVVATYSRGGFMGMLVLALFVIKNSRRKFLPILGVCAMGVLLVVLAPESWFERLNTINDVNDDGSFLGRVVVWKLSTLLAMDHPLLGGGPHAIQYLWVWNAYKPGFHLFDFIRTPLPDVVPHAAHSIWFEILGDYGFSGLFIFMAILGTGLLKCRRVVKLGRLHPEVAWAADLARALQITLVLYATTASALSMGYFEMYWIVIAIVSRTHRTVLQTIQEKGAAQAAVSGPGLSLQPGGALAGLPRPVLAPVPARAMSVTPIVPGFPGQRRANRPY